MAGGVLGRLQYLVGVDSGGVDRGIAEVEGKVKAAMTAIDHMDATATLRAESRDLDREIAKARAQILEFDAMKADPTVEVDDQATDDIARIKAQLKSLQAQKVRVAVEYAQAKEAKRHNDALAKSLDDVADAQRDLTYTQDASRLQMLRNRSELERMRQQYVKLRQEQMTAMRSTTMFGKRTDENRQIIRRTTAEMNLVGERIRQLGGNLTHLDAEADRTGGTFQRMARRIGGARVNIGPFSLKLGSFLPVLAGASTLVVDLAGALTALVGSLSLATAGLVSLGAAGFTGMALAATGAVFAIKPVITEMGAASDASKALTDAQLKYGKGSEEAKTAQENLNQTLAGMSPKARQVVKDWTALKTSFLDRTGGIRQSFVGGMAEGLKTARDLMPSFARESTDAFRAARDGWDDWMQGLRSPEAQRLMENIMGNFTRGIPDMMHGLGQFATALTRITSAASDFWPEFMRGFDREGSQFADATADANKLHDTMRELTDQTHSWFRLFGSMGRLITTVFTGGADSGQKMVEDFTRTLNRWNAELSSASGQRKMSEFFTQAGETAGRFFSVLGKVTQLLYDLSRIMEPITGGVLAFAQALGDVGHAIASVEPLKPLLYGIGAALAGLWTANKLRMLSTAVLGLGSGVTGLATRLLGVQAATTGTQLALTGLGTQTAKTGTLLGSTRLAALGTRGALLGVGGAAGAAAAIVGGAYLLSTENVNARMETLRESARKLGVTLNAPSVFDSEAFENMADGVGRANRAVRTLDDSIERARQTARRSAADMGNVNQAIKDHGKFSLQAARADQQADRSAARSASAQQDKFDKLREIQEGYGDAVAAAKDHVEELTTAQKRGISGHQRTEGAFADLHARIQDAREALRAVRNEQALGMLNVRRQFQGTSQITQRAASDVGKFAKAFKGIPAVQKFLVRTNSQQAVRQVSQVGNTLSRLGGKKAVVNILANAKSPEQAFRQISKAIAAINKADPTLDVSQKGAEGVLSILEKITGVKLPGKTQDVNESGSSGVLNALQAIIGKNIPNKSFQVAANVGGALSAISSVLGSLNSIPNVVTTTIQTIRKVVGNAEGGPLIGGYQFGGAPTREARSMKVTRPTYLTGEEAPRHPEWVIATNPSYRRQNTLYLDAAASDLGYQLIPAFRQGGRRGRGRGGGGGGGGGKGRDKPFVPPTEASLPPKPKAKHGKGVGAGSWYQWYQHAIGFYDAEASAASSAGNIPVAVKNLRSQASMILDQEREINAILGHYRHVISKGWKKYLGKGDKKALRKNFHFRKRQKGESKKAYHRAKRQAHKDFTRKKKDIKQQAKQENRSKDRDLKDQMPDLKAQLYSDLPQQYQQALATIRELVSGAATDAGVEQTAFGKERFQALIQYGGNFRGNEAQFGATGSRFGTSREPVGGAPRTFNSLMAGASGAGRPGRAPLLSGAAAAAAMGGPRGGLAAAGGPAAGGTTVVKNTNVTNNYKTQPVDPHTWSRNLRFEMEAMA